MAFFSNSLPIHTAKAPKKRGGRSAKEKEPQSELHALCKMFPEFQLDLVRDVYNDNGRDVDRTIEHLSRFLHDSQSVQQVDEFEQHAPQQLDADTATTTTSTTTPSQPLATAAAAESCDGSFAAMSGSEEEELAAAMKESMVLQHAEDAALDEAIRESLRLAQLEHEQQCGFDGVPVAAPHFDVRVISLDRETQQQLVEEEEELAHEEFRYSQQLEELSSSHGSEYDSGAAAAAAAAVGGSEAPLSSDASATLRSSQHEAAEFLCEMFASLTPDVVSGVLRHSQNDLGISVDLLLDLTHDYNDRECPDGSAASPSATVGDAGADATGGASSEEISDGSPDEYECGEDDGYDADAPPPLEHGVQLLTHSTEVLQYHEMFPELPIETISNEFQLQPDPNLLIERLMELEHQRQQRRQKRDAKRAKRPKRIVPRVQHFHTAGSSRWDDRSDKKGALRQVGRDSIHSIADEHAAFPAIGGSMAPRAELPSGGVGSGSSSSSSSSSKTMASKLRLDKLHERFPTADRDLVDSIFAGCNDNYDEAAAQIQLILAPPPRPKPTVPQVVRAPPAVKQQPVATKPPQATLPETPVQAPAEPTRPRRYVEPKAKDLPFIVVARKKPSTKRSDDDPLEGTAENYRGFARHHAQMRDDYFRNAARAYMLGRGDLAREWANKGRQHDELMHRMHRTYSHSLASRGDGPLRIDLHGLTVRESLTITEELLSHRGGTCGMARRGTTTTPALTDRCGRAPQAVLDHWRRQPQLPRQAAHQAGAQELPLAAQRAIHRPRGLPCRRSVDLEIAPLVPYAARRTTSATIVLYSTLLCDNNDDAHSIEHERMPPGEALHSLVRRRRRCCALALALNGQRRLRLVAVSARPACSRGRGAPEGTLCRCTCCSRQRRHRGCESGRPMPPSVVQVIERTLVVRGLPKHIVAEDLYMISSNIREIKLFPKGSLGSSAMVEFKTKEAITQRVSQDIRTLCGASVDIARSTVRRVTHTRTLPATAMPDRDMGAGEHTADDRGGAGARAPRDGGAAVRARVRAQAGARAAARARRPQALRRLLGWYARC